jgi:hypothetical protein
LLYSHRNPDLRLDGANLAGASSVAFIQELAPA